MKFFVWHKNYIELFAKRHICPDFMLLEKECDKQRVVSKRDEKKRNRKR